jgi:hypothetical protein
LTEARELFALNHFAAAQILAGAAAEVTFGNVILKPMVYGLVHSDTAAPILVEIVENTRQVYKFKALIVEIISQFTGINLFSKLTDGQKSLWESVDSVREQRNRILHGDDLSIIKKEEVEHSLTVATILLETVFPALLKTLGLHLHEVRICTDQSCGIKA